MSTCNFTNHQILFLVDYLRKTLNTKAQYQQDISNLKQQRRLERAKKESLQAQFEQLVSDFAELSIRAEELSDDLDFKNQVLFETGQKLKLIQQQVQTLEETQTILKAIDALKQAPRGLKLSDSQQNDKYLSHSLDQITIENKVKSTNQSSEQAAASFHSLECQNEQTPKTNKQNAGKCLTKMDFSSSPKGTPYCKSADDIQASPKGQTDHYFDQMLQLQTNLTKLGDLDKQLKELNLAKRPVQIHEVTKIKDQLQQLQSSYQYLQEEYVKEASQQKLKDISKVDRQIYEKLLESKQGQIEAAEQEINSLKQETQELRLQVIQGQAPMKFYQRSRKREIETVQQFEQLEPFLTIEDNKVKKQKASLASSALEESESEIVSNHSNKDTPISKRLFSQYSVLMAPLTKYDIQNMENNLKHEVYNMSQCQDKIVESQCGQKELACETRKLQKKTKIYTKQQKQLKYSQYAQRVDHVLGPQKQVYSLSTGDQRCRGAVRKLSGGNQ